MLKKVNRIFRNKGMAEIIILYLGSLFDTVHIIAYYEQENIPHTIIQSISDIDKHFYKYPFSVNQNHFD
jgi:hypothetical protein